MVAANGVGGECTARERRVNEIAGPLPLPLREHDQERDRHPDASQHDVRAEREGHLPAGVEQSGWSTAATPSTR
jgi:hypothetical protein